MKSPVVAVWTKNSSYYSRRPEPERIALLVSMINQAEVFLRWDIPGILNICADCEPSARCPADFMLLPSRSTSADLPVVRDTALLLCSFLLPAAKETRSGCLCPGDCAPRGNVRDIAAMLAAAKILQTGSTSTDILL